MKEINQAVNVMDQSTQQNAAMVEASTAAARRLSSEADALFELLGQFDIGANTTPMEAARGVTATLSKPALLPAHGAAARRTATIRGNVALASDWREF